MVVTLESLQFNAIEPPFELSFHDTIVEIGTDKDWIILRDRRQPDLQFFVDRAILDNGLFLKPWPIRQQVQSQLGRKELRRNFSLMITGLVAVVIIAWVGAHITSWGVRLAVKGISAKHEIEFGDQAFEEVKSRMDIIDDTNAVAKLDSLMAVLAPAVHSPVPFKFSVVDGPPNAFAVPGGRICVTTELLKIIDTPEQLLGILAHESAHIKQTSCFLGNDFRQRPDISHGNSHRQQRQSGEYHGLPVRTLDLRKFLAKIRVGGGCLWLGLSRGGQYQSSRRNRSPAKTPNV